VTPTVYVCIVTKAITRGQGGMEPPGTTERRKVKWIGHVLRRNCLERIEVMGRR